MGLERCAEQPSSTRRSSKTPKVMKVIYVQLKSANWVQNQIAMAIRATPVRENAKSKMRMSMKRNGLPLLIFSLNIKADE